MIFKSCLGEEKGLNFDDFSSSKKLKTQLLATLDAVCKAETAMQSRWRSRGCFAGTSQVWPILERYNLCGGWLECTL